tara:strand:- start:6936 stop:8564 length:1629 start_codon:yes stop_codon:yes gene_type:complete
MSDLTDFTGKNRKFTGTNGIDLPEGTEAQRVNDQGRLRFNTQSGLAEYYNGTIWKVIDAPPAVQSVSPTAIATDGSTLFTVTVTGTGFDSGGITAKFIGADGTEYNSASNNIDSATQVRIQSTAAMNAANGPYDIKVTNTGSGLAGTLVDAITGGSAPTFTSPSAASSLGQVYNGLVVGPGALTSIVASDPDGGTGVTFSISSGSLPAGLNLFQDGSVQGTVTSNSPQTHNFTVQISDGVNTATRAFTIVEVTPPTIDVLVVGGGGGGGGGNRGNDNYSGNGGGGAGGYRTGEFAMGAKTYTITVGGGGSGGPGGNSDATGGSNSEISAPGETTITSAGGGRGGRETQGGASGGSGGGGGSRNGEGPGAGSGGSGNTPSTSPSQGNGGGNGTNQNGAGGGGGANASGANGNAGGNGAAGGAGSANTITGSSVTYAGGGGGGIHGPPGNQGAGGSGGGGLGGRHPGPQNGTSGTANLGGGGGGSGPNVTGQGSGGGGGSGVVILRVPTAQYSGASSTGSPTITTDGDDTVLKFTGSGTYVHAT